MEETIREDRVTCPACLFVDRDCWELFGPDDWDGAETDYECPSCGVVLVVTQVVDITYSTKLRGS